MRMWFGLAMVLASVLCATLLGQESTPIEGEGSASPASAPAGSPVLIAVSVTRGTQPMSSGIAVWADLSAIGGPSRQPLLDHGKNADAIAGDAVFSHEFVIPSHVSAGVKAIPWRVTDAQDRSDSGSISLTILEVAQVLSGLGGVNPLSAAAGEAVLLTVKITPATQPASRGITVIADLSELGGSATQALLDNGLSGDELAGDDIFSYRYVLPDPVSAGQKSIPFSVSDAEGRAFTDSMVLMVLAGTAW